MDDVVLFLIDEREQGRCTNKKNKQNEDVGKAMTVQIREEYSSYGEELKRMGLARNEKTRRARSGTQQNI